jgi:hypothetical protein
MGLSEFLVSVRAIFTGRNYKYSAIPMPATPREAEPRDTVWSTQNKRLLKLTMGGTVFVIILYLAIAFG